MQLEVYLDELQIGHLTLTSEGKGVDTIAFDFHPSYLDLALRPVLGQRFEDEKATPPTHMRAPPWFSNLLPEGPLRDLISKRAGVHPEREFFLLAAVGDDLPGAVRIRPSGEVLVPAIGEQPAVHPPGELRFSLAGVQLKFSMVRDGKGLTIPARGVDGEWIVKLPGEKFDAVVENEFSMMTWARGAGIATAEFELTPMSSLTNLPSEVRVLSGNAFATRRYDRVAGKRVHQEDFAQVLGVYAHEKYEHANYETIANVFLRVAGEAALAEFVRRLVFVIASGNEDAHLKNWAFLYPAESHGMKATIAPAYDFVSTVVYPNLKRGLGLNLGGTRDFAKVGRRHFERLGERLASDVMPTVAAAVEQTLDSWSQLRSSLPLPNAFRDMIDEHLRSVRLFSEKP